MATSDSIIRNTVRQVLGREASQSDIDSARSIQDQDLASFFQGGGQSAGSGDPAQDFISQVLDDLTAPLREANERAKEFDDKNPFAFDEILARQSAEERFNPFFEAELRDFVTGVTKARGRTIEDTQSLVRELDVNTTQVSDRLKNSVQDAVKSSEEGFAGSGLLFSGAKERQEGKIEQAGEEDSDNFLRQQASKKRKAVTGQARTLEDIAAGEKTFTRKHGAAQETALETDVQGQRKESEQKREFERQQFIGLEGATGTGSLESIFGLR